MRGFVYAIAVVAAVGIMIVIATSPGPNATDSTADRTAGDDSVVQTASAESSQVMPEAGTLTLSVPKMHCEVACYPRVKEAIENTAGVSEVELAPQKEEGVLDNRQVIVSYDAGFDLSAALASLASEGYDESNVVQ